MLNWDTLIEHHPSLAVCKKDMDKALVALITCYEQGGKLLLCGNGGSCADCDHISGELLKGFLKMRPLSDEKKAAMQANCPELDEDTLSHLQGGLPAVPLAALTALNTAFCNDVEPSLLFAQGVMGLGKVGDILVAMSTSGNAANVCAAAKVAKGLGLTVLALTGEMGGKLAELADVCIRVPRTDTYAVQELHLPVYHYLCAAVEEHFFKA